jgi:hypothetical protein
VTAFVAFLVWVAVVLMIVGFFAAARTHDRHAEDAGREQEGLPPVEKHEDY